MEKEVKKLSDNKSFKEETFRMKLFIIITITFLLIASISFILGLFFFGTVGLFNILGVHYDSIRSIILFVLAYFLISFISDILVKVMKAFMVHSKKWNDSQITMGYFVISFLVNLMLISFINKFMHSIEINLWTQVIMAIILAILDIVFDNEK